MASTFDDIRFPSLADALYESNIRAAGRANTPSSQRNFLTAGVSSGIDQFQALSGRGLQAVGDLLGSRTISDTGAGIAERNFAEAAKNGRPDLESFPTDNLWNAPAWLGYQVAKQIPNVLMTAAAYKLGGSTAARFMPAAAAELGAVAPKWIGGGGLRAGMSAAEAAVARARGAKMAAGVLAQAPVNYPQAVGSMYDEAIQSGNEGRGAAAAALLGGVPYSLAEGFAPATLGRALEKGLTKGVVKRVATGAAVNAAQETLTEGIQTAMEQAFRPDLTVRERLANVVEGAVTGGVVGGVFGGFSGAVGGLRGVKTENPAAVTNDKIKETIDTILTPDADGQLRMPGTEARVAPAGSPAVDTRAEPAPEVAESTRTYTNFPDTGVGPFQYADTVQPAVEPAPVAEARRVYPEGSVGTARWNRYEDVGGPSGAEFARQAAAQMEEVVPDTGARPANPDQGMFELRSDGMAMPEQISPARKAELIQRFQSGEATQQDRALAQRVGLNEAELSKSNQAEPAAAQEDPALTKATTDLLGGAKAIWQKNVMAQPAADIVDRMSQVYEQVGLFTGNNVSMPKSLVTAGQKIGMLDKNGDLVNLTEKTNELETRASQLFETAKQTGRAEDQAKANKALREAKAWRDQRTTLEAAADRLKARSEQAQATATAAQAQAEAAQAAAVPEDQRPSTIEESAAVLNSAPPVPLTQTLDQRLQQRFQQRGSVSTAESSSTQTPGMKVVTKQDVATKQRKQNQRRAEARAQERARVVPPPTAEPTAAVQEQRKQVMARLNYVANDASLGEVGKESLRQQAVAAAAAYTAGAEGSDKAAYRVLAAHGKATGGTVASVRPVSERKPPMSSEGFETALEKIGSKLPVAAQQAIVVVDSAQQLPPEILEFADLSQMHPTDIRGVLHDGKVYIVKDQISSERELQEVIDHEVFGHGGARALLGDRRGPVMRATWDRMGGLEGLRAIARKYGVEKALNEYLPGRDLTANDKVALVDELLAQVQGATGKFGLMLRSWAGKFKETLLSILRSVGLTTLADRLDTFGPNQLAMTLSNMRKAVEAGNSLSGTGTAFLRGTPQGMNESLQNISKTADNVWSWVNNVRQQAGQSESRLRLNEFHLYTSTISHIVSSFGKMFDGKGGNPLRKFWDALVMRGVAEQRMAHAVANTYSKFESLLASNPAAEEQMNTLMKYTFDTIAPFKPWADHTWLQTKDAAETARNKAKVEAANNVYRKLNEPNNVEGRKVIQAYHEFIASNEGMHFAQQAMSLFNLMTSDKEISQAMKDKLESDGNPMDRFLQKTDTYDNVIATRDYWQAETKKLVEQAEAYLKAQNELANTVDKTSSAKIEQNTSSLKARLRTIATEQESMKQAPYFHLGRFGDWVLGFHVRIKDGKADPAAMEAIADRFRDAGVEGIEIPKDATRANAFIRFESKAERDAAAAIARELATKGYIRQDGDKEIVTFKRSDDKAMQAFDISKMPQWAQGLMDKIRAKEFGKIEGLSEEDQKLVNRLNNEFERSVSQYFLDLLPDTSLTKVMVHRNNVPGFSADMMRSQLFRAQVAGRALANLYAAGKMSEARAGLLDQAFAARSDLDTTRAQMKQNVVSELFLRESQRPHIEKNSWVDVARAINHAYFLGMTPAYPVVNLTQIGVLLWPELSKKHGFVNSAKAIGKVTPTAFKVLGAVWNEARKSGWKNLPDASINTQVLRAAGLSDSMSNFVMRIVNSGILDIGSQSREIGRIVEGQKFSRLDNALRWASSFGYYSEMLSRLVAALSARELHGGYSEEMYQYVDDTVRQSMLSYETWNQARATGKMGLLGEYTPIMTSLMQYTFQLTEKLYREFHDGFMNSNLSAEEKSAARTFLGTHLAAIVTLTGTLGMPMASAFAGVFDLLANSIWKDKDDEPMNIRMAYRNWLTDVFGDTAGDMIARGVPRIINVDISSRAGEQDLLPYLHIASKLLTDKREWKDKVADDTFRTLGAPISMANNIISGGSQFMSGNYMDGLIEMMPPAIKGPLKAAKLVSDGGYTDQKGSKIPNMTVGTSDVLAQALGFNPGQNAENQEAKNDQRVLQGAMINKASQIRENIAVAYERGDKAAFNDYLQAAREFDAKNPEFKILKTISQVLRSRAKEREASRRSGAPLGVKPGLADRTRYGISD